MGACELRRGALAKALASKTVWNQSSHIAAITAPTCSTTLIPGQQLPFPEVAVRRRGHAAVLRWRQARRDCCRLLRRLRHDRPRRDAAQQAGRRPPAVDHRHEQRSVRRRAEGAARAGLRPGDPDWEQLGSATTSPSRGSRLRSPARRPTASRSRATTSSRTSSRWRTASRRTSSSSP